MPENGSVNSGGGASSSSSTSSSSSSSTDNSSNDSQTTEESLSSSPTTGDTLSGGQEAGKSGDSDGKSGDAGKSGESNNTNSHTNGDSDSDKDKANENKNNSNSNNNKSNNDKSDNAAANDNINNVADSGKENFNSRNNTEEKSGYKPSVSSELMSDLTNSTIGFAALDLEQESDLPPPPPEPESDIPNLADINNPKTEPREKSLTEDLLDKAEDVSDAISDVSRTAGDAITGFLDAGFNAAVDTVNLAAGTVNTGLDITVGPVVDSVEALTGTQAHSVFPDAQRGYNNYNKAAETLETMITDPIGVIDAAIEPVRSDWNAGNRAEAVGRGAFEIGSVFVGGAGALGKIPGGKQADLTTADSNALKQTGGGSQSKSADEMYEAIRTNETDVKSISENTGFKETNIEKVKDHVFNDEHVLDRYVDQGVPAETKRFDSNVDQAEAWNRLEEGTHTKEDITWMKHEAAESWYEKKYDSGYSEAHDRVEGRWSGNPWGNE